MFMIRIAILPAAAALVKCGRVTRLFACAFRCERVALLVLHAVCIAVVLRLSRSRTRLALAMITLTDSLSRHFTVIQIYLSVFFVLCLHFAK